MRRLAAVSLSAAACGRSRVSEQYNKTLRARVNHRQFYRAAAPSLPLMRPGKPTPLPALRVSPIRRSQGRAFWVQFPPLRVRTARIRPRTGVVVRISVTRQADNEPAAARWHVLSAAGCALHIRRDGAFSIAFADSVWQFSSGLLQIFRFRSSLFPPILIAHQRTYARYWYGISVCLYHRCNKKLS